MPRDNGTRVVTLAAVLAALTNILSFQFLTIPIVIGPFNSSIHFTQLPIFLSGILAGPWAGFVTGFIGGIYMSYSTGIPFVIGGLGLLGFMTGVFAKRFQLYPAVATSLAWCVQAPYVFVTDYIWFIASRTISPEVALAIVSYIILKLTVEAIISAVLSAVLVKYLQRIGVMILGRADHHEQLGTIKVRTAELPERTTDCINEAGRHVDRTETAVGRVVGRTELLGEHAGERLHLVTTGKQGKFLGIGFTQVRETLFHDLERPVP